MGKKRQEIVTEVATDWRSQALETLPELTNEITSAVNPMGLWINIGFEFDAAYTTEPRNDDLIRRIYGFASWCIEQPRSELAEDDLFTCVVIGFYEDIPLNKVARADMPRWFTLEDVRDNKQVFSYHLSAAEYEALLILFSPTKSSRQGKQKTLAPPRWERKS